MKHHHLFSEKNRWHACPQTHPEQQICGPILAELPLTENDPQKKSSPSEVLQQWLKAGGKPGDASIHHVEIFVGTA